MNEAGTMNTNLNPATTTAQLARIRTALLAGERLTPLDTLTRYGCFRLGARIWDLRHKEGMAIKSETVQLTSGKRVALYYIEQNEKQ